MRGVLLLLALLSTLLDRHLALGVRVEQTVPLACEGAWDVSNHNMYDLAYKWTHEHTLRDWSYVSLREPGCAQVSYLTTIRLASTFQHFVPSRVLSSSMRKKVCVRGSALEETLVLGDLVLINSLQIDMRATLHNDNRTVVFVSATEFPVPWFLKLFENTIRLQLEASLREYHALLASSLCVGGA